MKITAGNTERRYFSCAQNWFLFTGSVINILTSGKSQIQAISELHSRGFSTPLSPNCCRDATSFQRSADGRIGLRIFRFSFTALGMSQHYSLTTPLLGSGNTLLNAATLVSIRMGVPNSALLSPLRNSAQPQAPERARAAHHLRLDTRTF